MTPINAAQSHDGAGAAPGTVTVVEPSAAVPVFSRGDRGGASARRSAGGTGKETR